MALKKVRPGLYERIDTPRDVKITQEFADAVRQNSHSTLLKEIVEQALHEDEGKPAENGRR